MPTSRQSTEVFSFRRRSRFFNSLGQVFVDGLDDVGSYSAAQSVTLGDPLPNYKKLIATGQNATTELFGTKHRIDCLETNISVRRTYDSVPGYYEQYDVSGPLLWLSTPSFSDKASVIETSSNRSVAKFYSNLQAVETAFKGLVFSGELKQSLTMIRHPARELRRGISRYLSSIKRYGRLPKDRRLAPVRDTWLEYSFGWSPLINDVDSAIKAFYSSRLVRPIFEMVRGNALVTGLIANQHASTSTGFGSLKYRIEDRFEAATRHYGVYHSLGSGVPDSHHYGFRPNEFVPTLWELIPYSFLVDYFTNIGGILESWSYRTQKLNFCSLGTSQSEIREALDFKHIPTPDSGGEKYRVLANSPGSYRFSKTVVARTPHVGFPAQTFELKVPGRWFQWANIVALTDSLASTRRTLNH